MGMASVDHSRRLCVNQVGKTHYKPLAARLTVCESAFNVPRGRKALGEKLTYLEECRRLLEVLLPHNNGTYLNFPFQPFV